MLASVSQRWHLTCSQPWPPLRHWPIVGDGCGAIGRTHGLLCGFTRTVDTYPGPDDPAAVNDLARLGAYGGD
jgi:hypothetical protein